MKKSVAFTGIVLMCVLGATTAQAENHPHVGPEIREGMRIFRFPSDLRAGDCHMDGGTVTVTSNGHVVFEGLVWTHTHGSDQWHSTVHLVGPGGEKGAGHGDSPWMPHNADGPGNKRLLRYEFNIAPGEVGNVTEAWEEGGC